MRLARYFEQDAVRTELYLVRECREGDIGSYMTHMGDLVANFDMLLVAIKGAGADPQSKRYNPGMAREKLEEARQYLERLVQRLEEAEEMAWLLF